MLKNSVPTFLSRKKGTLMIVIIYFITAWYSTGFHQADEHYQIIDFANYKLGLQTKESLAWEFDYKIRSALMPFICYQIFNLAIYLGINDPFKLAFILRIFSSSLFLVIMSRFVQINKFSYIQAIKENYIFCSYLLCFLPYIYVRFSSESISSILLMLSLTFVISRNGHQRDYIFCGFFCGLSFLCRFQMGLMIMGLFAWQLLINKDRFGNIIIQLISFLCILLLGVILDYWLYGNIILSAYNYFFWNIWQGVSSEFGTSPWYSYVIWSFTRIPFPIGLIILICLIRFFTKYPKHLATWVILPYLIIHSIIPHKEFRFLFPVAIFMPLIVCDNLKSFRINFYSIRTRAFLFMIAVCNIFWMLLLGTKGAGDGRLALSKYVKEKFSVPVTLLYTEGSDPYNPYPGNVSEFYKNVNVQLKDIGSIWNIPKNLETKQKTFILIAMHHSEVIGKESKMLLLNNHLLLRKNSLPALHFKLHQLTKGLFFDDPILLYEVVKQ